MLKIPRNVFPRGLDLLIEVAGRHASQEKGIRNKIYDVEKCGLRETEPKGLPTEQTSARNLELSISLSLFRASGPSSTVKAFATLASRAKPQHYLAEQCRKPDTDTDKQLRRNTGCWRFLCLRGTNSW